MGVSHETDIVEREAADRSGGVVHHIDVEIGISVIVEKGRVNRVAFVIQTVLARRLSENRNPLFRETLM